MDYQFMNSGFHATLQIFCFLLRPRPCDAGQRIEPVAVGHDDVRDDEVALPLLDPAHQRHQVTVRQPDRRGFATRQRRDDAAEGPRDGGPAGAAAAVRARAPGCSACVRLSGRVRRAGAGPGRVAVRA